ncbi:hypothetical protein JHK87_034078 [Glycine soja]|nr:hypothetical protein JHK87_034078 [Glycine soja]
MEQESNPKLDVGIPRTIVLHEKPLHDHSHGWHGKVIAEILFDPVLMTHSRWDLDVRRP